MANLEPEIEEMSLAFTNDSEFIQQLTEIVLSNIEDEKFGVEELVSISGISGNVLRHRLKTLTQKTISQFISEIRLKQALDLLKAGGLTVAEVAYHVGFGSPEYFNRVFHDFFGYSPGEVKKRSSENHENKEDGVLSRMHGDSVSHQVKTLAGRSVNRKILYASAGVLFLTIILVIVYHVFINNPVKGKSEQDCSIVVLPSVINSLDSTQLNFLNLMTEAITGNLIEMTPVQVRPPVSAQEFMKNNSSSLSGVARNLKADYFVTLSGQLNGEQLNVIVNLFETRSNRGVFSKPYNGAHLDFFQLSGEIAFSVASKMEEVIYPERQTGSNQKPDARNVALALIAQAVSLHQEGEFYNNRPRHLHLDSLAEKKLYQALLIDSTLAEAYNNLSLIYRDRGKKDSAMIFNEKALHFDSRNSRAYTHKAMLLPNSQINEKERLFNLSYEYNRNNSVAAFQLGLIYSIRGNFSKALEYNLKALKIIGPPTPDYTYNLQNKYQLYTRSFFNFLFNLDFFEQGNMYAEQYYKLKNDTVNTLFYELLFASLKTGRFNGAYELGCKNPEEKKYFYYNLWMGTDLLYLNRYSEAVEYYN